MINIHKSKDGQFYFVVKAKNGEIMCTSETYTRKSNLKKGIAALRKVMLKYYIKTIDHTTKKK